MKMKIILFLFILVSIMMIVYCCKTMKNQSGIDALSKGIIQFKSLKQPYTFIPKNTSNQIDSVKNNFNVNQFVEVQLSQKDVTVKTFDCNAYLYNDEDLTELYVKAEQGDVRAQYNLGKYYYDCGTNYMTSSDFLPKAVDLFRKSAEKGFAESQYAFGICHLRFYPTKEGHRPYSLINPESPFYNIKNAIIYFEKSAQQGYAPAQYNLVYWSYIYSKFDDFKAVELIKNSAEQGYAPAQHMLSKYYETGFCVELNADKAAEWRKKAFNHGRMDAILDQYKIYQLQ